MLHINLKHGGHLFDSIVIFGILEHCHMLESFSMGLFSFATLKNPLNKNTTVFGSTAVATN